MLLCIILACKKQPKYLYKIQGERVEINDKIKSKSSISEFIKPYKENIDKNMNVVLSYAPSSMHKNDGELESTIGNLMADIIYNQTQPIFNKRTNKNIDFVLLNHGGIRAGISKGSITKRTAFEIMPFENSIVVTELSYEKIEALINYLVKAKRAHPISQATMILNNDFSLKTFKINTKTLKKDETYFVATSDYLLNGGDNMSFFKDPKSLHVLDYKIRNAMIDYFTKTDTLPAKLDNRFIRLH